MKRILLIVIVSVLVLMAGGGITAVTLLSQQPEQTVTKISFSVTEIDILVGDVQELPLVKDRQDGNVRVVSSNSDILSIEEDGRIKAIDTIGNNISTVYVTATNELGDKAYLNVNVYNDVSAYIESLGQGLYAVYRVYNPSDDSWRIAGFRSYQKGDYLNAPVVQPTPGCLMDGNWYDSEELTQKVVFQNRVITNSIAVYAEEYVKDGSAKVGGLIDLEIDKDPTYGYVVTGLTYDRLKYESITIPKTYTITLEDGTTQEVDIVGIADGAFAIGEDEGNGQVSNIGLQALKRVDLSHIKFIGKNAFKNCLLLETIVFYDGAVTIAPSSFEGTAWQRGNNA